MFTHQDIFWVDSFALYSAAALCLPFVMGFLPRLLNTWAESPADPAARGWRPIALVVGILIWVQFAQYILVRAPEVPGAASVGMHVPWSSFLFPLTLVALLAARAARADGLLRRLTSVLVVSNLGLVVLTYGLRHGWAEAAGLPAAWSPLWDLEATRVVLLGDGVLVLDVLLMFWLFDRLAARRGRHRFLTLAVPLWFGLLLDAVLFAGVLTAEQGGGYFGRLGGQLSSKWAVGLLYAWAFNAYFVTYHVTRAGIEVGERRRADNGWAVFREVVSGMCRAVVMLALVMSRYFSPGAAGTDPARASGVHPLPDLGAAGRGADPAVGLTGAAGSGTSVTDPGTTARVPPTDGRNDLKERDRLELYRTPAEAHAAARKAFTGELPILLSAGPSTIGRWVAYYGAERVGGPDESREQLARRCRAERQIPPGHLSLFEVAPAGD